MPPISFPKSTTRSAEIPDTRSTVRTVEGKASTPAQKFTVADHLTMLKFILDRATAKGGVMHPQEILKAKQCVEALEKAEDDRHAESLKGNGHD